MTASRRSILILCTAAAMRIASNVFAAAFVNVRSNYKLRCHRSFSNLHISNGDGFVDEVTSFLRESNIKWSDYTMRADDRTILAVRARNADTSSTSPFSLFLLHLCPTPTLTTNLIEENRVGLYAWRNTRLTNAFASKNQTIVHLHEDVWNRSPEIVQSRLRSKCGMHNKRIYARKTIAKRITKSEYLPFLDENHLWGATGAKYAFGLYTKVSAREKESKLVAVATFSNKRKVKRASNDFHSYELLRFCTEMGSTVVGGLSKLNKAFVNEIARTKLEECDNKTGIDIVTSIDRDFGTNAWPNFECMDTMNPLPMFVGTDGIRRHAVGVGLTPLDNGEDIIENMSTSSLLRVGLPHELTEELKQVDNVAEAEQTCWDVANRHGFVPVFDAGVERLMLVVDKGSSDDVEEPETLWSASTPKFVTDHYSPNAGIEKMINCIRCSKSES